MSKFSAHSMADFIDAIDVNGPMICAKMASRMAGPLAVHLGGNNSNTQIAARSIDIARCIINEILNSEVENENT